MSLGSTYSSLNIQNGSEILSEIVKDLEERAEPQPPLESSRAGTTVTIPGYVEYQYSLL